MSEHRLRLQRLLVLVLFLTVFPAVSLTFISPVSAVVSGPLKYTLGYRGYPSPGATILLVHNFTVDAPTYDIMINSFTVTTRWGFLNSTGGYGLPRATSWPGSILVNTTLQIPASTAFGTYPVNIWINWDYKTILTGWLGQDLVVNASLQVSPKPPFTIPITIPKLPSWTLSGVLFYLGAASLLTVLVAGREEKRRHNRLEFLGRYRSE